MSEKNNKNYGKRKEISGIKKSGEMRRIVNGLNMRISEPKEKDKKENQNCHRVLLSSKQLLDNGSGLNEDKIGKNIE